MEGYTSKSTMAVQTGFCTFRNRRGWQIEGKRGESSESWGWLVKMYCKKKFEELKEQKNLKWYRHFEKNTLENFSNLYTIFIILLFCTTPRNGNIFVYRKTWIAIVYDTCIHNSYKHVNISNFDQLVSRQANQLILIPWNMMKL